MSKITTHILDTAMGRPAENVLVTLYQVRVSAAEGEIEIASARTSKDGRITDWQGEADSTGNGPVDGEKGRERMRVAGLSLGTGIYKLRFETKDYFDRHAAASLYPFVDIYFEMTGNGHYHIPLLISPFGYSTYRGS